MKIYQLEIFRESAEMLFFQLSSSLEHSVPYSLNTWNFCSFLWEKKHFNFFFFRWSRVWKQYSPWEAFTGQEAWAQQRNCRQRWTDLAGSCKNSHGLWLPWWIWEVFMTSLRAAWNIQYQGRSSCSLWNKALLFFKDRKDPSIFTLGGSSKIIREKCLSIFSYHTLHVLKTISWSHEGEKDIRDTCW